MTTMRLWHGGVPGLRRGDRVRPGHGRQQFDDCPWCQERAIESAGGQRASLDPLSRHQDRVYLTTSREYARHFASLWGRGDLYRVEPEGELLASTEDTIATWTAPAARVLAVYDRAVLMTWSQRRALDRQWAAADLASAKVHELEELFHDELPMATP